MSNKSENPQDNRPLSPHLSVYKPQITSMMSITHRATGVFLSLGLLMLVWWIGAASSGGEAYTNFTNFAGSILGQLLLAGWSYAIFYHMLNGIRHLFWDAGLGFELKSVTASGVAVITLSLALTAGVWALVLL